MARNGKLSCVDLISCVNTHQRVDFYYNPILEIFEISLLCVDSIQPVDLLFKYKKIKYYIVLQ